MSTETVTTDPLEEADNQAGIDHFLCKKAIPLDVRARARVRARAAKVTEQIRQKHGVLSIPVDLIRDARDQ
jgi:hypothetical protein